MDATWGEILTPAAAANIEIGGVLARVFIRGGKGQQRTPIDWAPRRRMCPRCKPPPILPSLCFRIASTGRTGSAPRRSCRCRAPRWTRSAGMPATSCWSPATPMSTIRASAWRSSAGCWRRRASGSASSPSRTGRAPSRSRRWASRRCSSASPAATWIPWSTATPRTGACATTTATRPAARAASGPTAAVIVYAQRCREAFRDVPIVLGGIESSLRRIAHYDYWSDKVRRSILADAKADILLYGNAERAVVEVAHRLAAGAAPRGLDDIRGVALFKPRAGGLDRGRTPTISTPPTKAPRIRGDNTVIRLPAFEQVEKDPRGLCARLARAAPREQSRQCPSPGPAPRRPRAVGERRRRSR